MSEYQRYEFMTVDRPLTRDQLDEVNALSSHIEANARHAIIEYNWGNFKHDPIRVLRTYFDGFLYWANWGSPRLAFRFPTGILPANLLDDYDFDESVTLTRGPTFDVLDIHFNELEAPDEWTDYELGSLINIREELMNGDLRALYLAWLALHQPREHKTYYNDDYDEYDEDDEDDGFEHAPQVVEKELSDDKPKKSVPPPVPDDFATLTSAQQALAELLQIPQELLVAVAQHSKTSTPVQHENMAALLDLLPAERGKQYLLRLAHNESGLSRLLVRELRELQAGQNTEPVATGEYVSFETLLEESYAIKTRLEREESERKEQARIKHLQAIYDNWDNNWQKVDEAAARGVASGYDQALRLLLDLREAAAQFKVNPEFQHQFLLWLHRHQRRPALVRRLQEHKFTLPEA